MKLQPLLFAALVVSSVAYGQISSQKEQAPNGSITPTETPLMLPTVGVQWSKKQADGTTLVLRKMPTQRYVTRVGDKRMTYAEASAWLRKNPTKTVREVKPDSLTEYRVESLSSTGKFHLLLSQFVTGYQNVVNTRVIVADASYYSQMLTVVLVNDLTWTPRGFSTKIDPRNPLLGDKVSSRLITSFVSSKRQLLFDRATRAGRKIYFQDARIMEQPGKTAKSVELSWSDSGTELWSVDKGVWKIVRPYTPPPPPTKTELAQKAKRAVQQEWMGNYKGYRELGLSREKAIQQTREFSGLKNWTPLKEAWDTPDFNPPKPWLTPQPSPSVTPVP